jgi:nicotinamidase-related amidase
MEKKGLVIVDLQNDYFEGGKWTCKNINTASENAVLLLNHFRIKGMPVFHVQHIFDSNDAPFFQANTGGAEIHADLQPIFSEPLFVKNTVNPFASTSLLAALQEQQVLEVIVCGAMSHMCIDATVRAAADHGFKVVVAEDACGRRDLEFRGQVIPAEQVHLAYMSALGFAYANVTTTSQVIKGD